MSIIASAGMAQNEMVYCGSYVVSLYSSTPDYSCYCSSAFSSYYLFLFVVFLLICYYYVLRFIMFSLCFLPLHAIRFFGIGCWLFDIGYIVVLAFGFVGCLLLRGIFIGGGLTVLSFLF